MGWGRSTGLGAEGEAGGRDDDRRGTEGATGCDAQKEWAKRRGSGRRRRRRRKEGGKGWRRVSGCAGGGREASWRTV